MILRGLALLWVRLRPSPRHLLVQSTILLSATLLFAAVGGSSSSISTSSHYDASSSVRALDRYGNAMQLKHAAAAADLQGRLIVAIARPGRAIWVVSCPPKRPSHRRNYVSTGDNIAGLISKTKTEKIIYPEDCAVNVLQLPITADSAFLVCTGVLPDAQCLTRHLQSYGRNIFERYDNPLSAVAAARSASIFKRGFWNYWDNADSDQKLWKGAAMVSGGDQERSWSRPLGVRSMILSLAPDQPTVQLIEPSGSCSRMDHICCIGKGSALVQDRLETDFGSGSVDDDALEELIVKVLLSSLGNVVEKVLFERISASGIERHLVYPNRSDND